MNIDLTPFFANSGSIAFEDKSIKMPIRNGIPITKDLFNNEWNKLKNTPLTPPKRLIYIHIPFCATHCAFCGFYQNPLHKHDTETYTRYLLQEMELEVDSPLVQSTPIHAVYFGGGTPTVLTGKQMTRVIQFLKNNYPLAPDCEITIEGRVLNFDENRMEAYLKAGANRFSIGIQTFDTHIRKKMGRYANKEQAVAFIEKLASYNLAAVVCDLMFGLPEQSEKSWIEDMHTIKDLPLDGVDLYALNLLPTTKLCKSVEEKKITIPSIEDRQNFYKKGSRTLYELGWAQLSNSHWAKTTRERNLYNLLIKQGADYLAYGSGGGGKLNNYSFMLERDLANYYQALDNNQKPIMFMAQNTLQSWQQKLQGQIEIGRIDLTTLTDKPELLNPLINQWHHRGLLTDNSHCLRLSTIGRFWARNMLPALQKVLTQINSSNLLVNPKYKMSEDTFHQAKI